VSEERRTALIAGASGITGGNLARHLIADGWTVYGIARRPAPETPGLIGIAADLRDPEGLRQALTGVSATYAFYCTWSRQQTESANCEVNGAMLANFLGALRADRLEHAALVTGTKHYYNRAAGTVCETPFLEDESRLSGENFYHVMEDVLVERAARGGFSWSVHRPNTVIGYALGNQMNLGVTLAVYAVICRETGAPFVFPGSRFLWSALSQITDAGLLARHLAWAAVTPGARNQAFNVANDDLFRWRRLWPLLAGELGVEPAPPPEQQPRRLSDAMRDAGALWPSIIARHGLRPFDVASLAAWWHVDSDLGREFESLADISKSRRLGFAGHAESRASFTTLFERLRRERVIPR
jgi:nucleoside-diphosphate-sugar epimerase